MTTCPPKELWIERSFCSTTQKKAHCFKNSVTTGKDYTTLFLCQYLLGMYWNEIWIPCQEIRQSEIFIKLIDWACKFSDIKDIPLCRRMSFLKIHFLQTSRNIMLFLSTETLPRYSKVFLISFIHLFIFIHHNHLFCFCFCPLRSKVIKGIIN